MGREEEQDALVTSMNGEKSGVSCSASLTGLRLVTMDGCDLHGCDPRATN